MLNPLPYLIAVKDYFKSQTKTWEYFANTNNKSDQLQTIKNDLLKNTYKFDIDTDRHMYDKVTLVKEKLGLLQLPVTLYQAEYATEMNASILFLDGEAHIIFSGAILKLLNDEELSAVLAHEISHTKLYTWENGDLEIADRIITSIANNYHSEPSYYETARLFRLYTEIYCDRGAFIALENKNLIISSLVKISTGLDKINAESYIKQADEIFTNEQDLKTAGVSHPENFIRAKAIDLWSKETANANDTIVQMIEGAMQLDNLDIFAQVKLSKLTNEFLQLFLKPKWIKTSLVTNQALQYFPDFAFNESKLLTDEFRNTILSLHASIKNYLAYCLLDFAFIDPSLDEVPTGWAYQFAEDVGIKEVLDDVMKKELKLNIKTHKIHKEKSLSAYYEVKESDADQIYE